ncbi:MAG TPA: hypothetical protein VHC20_06235 [Candidatus Paceibacterota bacterium]|nr:hypothetical protein [Candidatus Paceibacterota bacterium]
MRTTSEMIGKVERAILIRSDARRIGAKKLRPVKREEPTSAGPLDGFIRRAQRGAAKKKSRWLSFVRSRTSAALARDLVRRSSMSKKSLTSRQSQRRCASRRLLTHPSRRAASWLIFNVRHRNSPL